MGSVPCKSRLARDRMAEFLRSTMRPFGGVCDEASVERATFEEAVTDHHRQVFPLPSRDHLYDPTREFAVGNALAYGSGASKVGFNFSTYMHTVLAWAALRVGRKRGLNALACVGRAHQPVPYYTYDSNPTPVLLPSMMLDWSDVGREYGKTHWEVTHLGLRVADEVARTHAVMPEKWAKTDEELAWLKRLAARDTALRTITEREMRRLDVLWDAEP